MSNVFLKNTTTSTITVTGYTVYYIDNTNAEIVEVESTAGEPLPSVGDTVTFGNYQQTSSTPTPIEWIVLDVEDGCALLISKKILDACQFHLSKSNTTWETSAFRTWLNSTFLNTAFDSTEKIYIQQSHIQTPSNPTYGTSGGNDTGDYIFVLSIQEATNYFANDTDRKAFATDITLSSPYRTSNAMSDTSLWHNSDNCAVWILRSMGETSTKAANVSHEGVVWVQGDDINSNWTGFRPALWMKCKSKYNAFKYTLSGTSYWYVIDGEHETWTNDLSALGYREVPTFVLPTVSVNPWVYFTYRMQDSYYQFNSGSERNIYTSATSQYSTIQYDSSSTYAVRDAWYNSNIVARTQLQCFNNSGVLAVRNVSSESFRSSGCYYCTCSDSAATVVPVYNSSNAAYNAFKFTAGGTDYYYALDGVQSDWTDDLSSIGYHLPEPINYIEFILGMNYSNSDWVSVQFNYNAWLNWWYGGFITEADKNAFEAFGGQTQLVQTVAGPYGEPVYDDTNFTYEILDIYEDINGQISQGFDLTHFSVIERANSANYTHFGILCDSSYSTPRPMAWRCRITKNS